MKANLNTLISMTEANRNFSKVAKQVDLNGSAIIMKNNAPKYIVADYNKIDQNLLNNDMSVEEAFNFLVNKYEQAFEELAK